LSKTIIKKKSIGLTKSTKKIKLALIFEILSQSRSKSRKNLINSNNENISKRTNDNNKDKIYNNFTKLSMSFLDARRELFINKSISVKTQYSNETINFELKKQKQQIEIS